MADLEVTPDADGHLWLTRTSRHEVVTMATTAGITDEPRRHELRRLTADTFVLLDQTGIAIRAVEFLGADALQRERMVPGVRAMRGGAVLDGRVSDEMGARVATHDPSGLDRHRASALLSARDVRDYDGPPLYLFIGISTAGSSVFDLFPLWAPMIAQGGVLRGVDLPETAPPDAFRNLVIAMRDNPHVIGAVVTSHKLRLYRAIHDLLDSADVLTEITHEISALDTRAGLRAYARDPQSLDVVIDEARGPGASNSRPVYCIGSGGAAIALLLAMGLDIPASLGRRQVVVRSPSNPRGPLTIIGCDPASLRLVAEVQERAGLDGAPISLVLAETPEDTADAIRLAPEGSIIANGTGLGKLSPGSPLAGPNAFPHHVLAWDFNYRGPLTFLRQAAQAGLRTEDGWDYFVAGWAASLAAVSGEELTPDHLSAMRLASDGLRPRSRR